MTRRLRLRRMSAVMAAACLFLMAVLLLGQVAIWFLLDPCSDWLAGTTENTLPRDVLTQACAGAEPAGMSVGSGLPDWKRIGGFAVGLLPVAVAIFGLSALRRLFRLYAAGEAFTPANTRALRHFAMSVFGTALVNPLALTLTVLIFTIDNPPGQRQLTLSFNQGDATALFLGVLFLAIAWVMDEAREIAEDHAQIV